MNSLKEAMFDILKSSGFKPRIDNLRNLIFFEKYDNEYKIDFRPANMDKVDGLRPTHYMFDISVDDDEFKEWWMLSCHDSKMVTMPILNNFIREGQK